MIEFTSTVIFGLIICLPSIYAMVLKTELNITNNKLNYYRDRALKQSKLISSFPTLLNFNNSEKTPKTIIKYDFFENEKLLDAENAKI